MPFNRPVAVYAGSAGPGPGGPLVGDFNMNESASVTRANAAGQGDLSVVGNVPSENLNLPNRAAVITNAPGPNHLESFSAAFQFQKNVDQSFTIAARLRVTAPGNLFFLGDVAPDRVCNISIAGGARNLRWQYSGDGTNTTLTPTGNGQLANNTYEWADFTFDPANNRVSIRVNQGTRNFITIPASFTLFDPAGSFPMRIGQAFDGAIDELYMWTGAQSDATIDAKIALHSP